MNQEEFVYDETPKKSEVLWGLLLGLGYLTIIPVLPYFVLIGIFGVPIVDSPQDTFFLALSQVLAGFIVVLIMAIVSKRVIRRLGKNFTFKTILMGLALAIITYFAVTTWGIIDQALFGSITTNENQSQIEALISGFPATGIIFTVLVAPIIEELIYRYYLYKGLEKTNVILAFVVTVFSLAAMHLIPSLTSGTLLSDLRSLPMYLIASFIFTFAYYKTKTLSVSIFAHMIYNGISIVLLLFLA